MSKIDKKTDKIAQWREKHKDLPINFAKFDATVKDLRAGSTKLDKLTEQRNDLKALLKEQLILLNDYLVSAKFERDELKEKQKEAAKLASKEASAKANTDKANTDKA